MEIDDLWGLGPIHQGIRAWGAREPARARACADARSAYVNAACAADYARRCGSAEDYSAAEAVRTQAARAWGKAAADL